MPFTPTGSRAASLGSAFGTGIAKPIQQGLDFLAEQKMSKIINSHNQQIQDQERQRISKSLSPILGPKTAEFVASQSPENQKHLFQNFGALTGLESLLNGSDLGEGSSNKIELGSENTAQSLMGNKQEFSSPNNQDQRSKLIRDLFTSPQQKRSERDLEIKEENLALKKDQQKHQQAVREEDLNLKKSNQQHQQQQTVKPFIDAEVADYKAQSQAAKIAKEMKANITKNYKSWPGAIKGNLPGEVQKLIQRNPNVRKYSADANKLVQAIASTRKGTVTNYKLALEALSKADLGQPIQTQIALLDEVINDYNDAAGRQKYIRSLKDKNGNYPLDLPQKAVEFDLAVKNPLEYPSFYEEGTEYTENDGKKYIVRNGEWEDL